MFFCLPLCYVLATTVTCEHMREHHIRAPNSSCKRLLNVQQSLWPKSARRHHHRHHHHVLPPDPLIGTYKRRESSRRTTRRQLTTAARSSNSYKGFLLSVGLINLITFKKKNILRSKLRINDKPRQNSAQRPKKPDVTR